MTSDDLADTGEIKFHTVSIIAKSEYFKPDQSDSYHGSPSLCRRGWLLTKDPVRPSFNVSDYVITVFTWLQIFFSGKSPAQKVYSKFQLVKSFILLGFPGESASYIVATWFSLHRIIHVYQNGVLLLVAKMAKIIADECF